MFNAIIVRFLFYSLPLVAWLFFSCRNTHAYEKYCRELDSLKIVVDQSLTNFKSIDSLSCYEAYSKQYTYIRFLNQHLTDTLPLQTAEQLRSFAALQEGYKTYLSNRSYWINKAGICIKQLGSLSHDLKNGSVSTEDAVAYINNEKKLAEETIGELKTNTETMRAYQETFIKTVPVAEAEIKRINNGLLPDLIKPDIKH